MEVPGGEHHAKHGAPKAQWPSKRRWLWGGGMSFAVGAAGGWFVRFLHTHFGFSSSAISNVWVGVGLAVYLGCVGYALLKRRARLQ